MILVILKKKKKIKYLKYPFFIYFIYFKQKRAFFVLENLLIEITNKICQSVFYLKF